jgi:hypothetical protein
MKGWLDNFGKADNANDSNVSLPEGFVGLGYNTKGRNYSPAWGGQFQGGGKLIPVSPMQQITGETPTISPTVPYLQTKDPAEFYKSWIQSPEYERRLKSTGYSDVPNKQRVDELSQIEQVKKERLGLLENIQPLEYDPSKRSEAIIDYYDGSTINVNPSDYKTFSKQSVEAHEIAHVATPTSTMSNDEFGIFMGSMLPLKKPIVSGVQGSKEREASKEAVGDFEHLGKPWEAKADLDALRFMMYDKGIYDITKGKKFTESDFEKAKQSFGKERVFKRFTDRMGKKNFVNLMNTIAKADGEEELPMAMGGMSIPGSVGFTYARTAGSAPSKGKYAKKTMASAQNGIMSPMLLARNVLNYFYPNEEAAPTVEAAPSDYKKGLTNELLQRQAYKESTFNPAAVSPAGYKGLTQIGEGVLEDYSNKKGGKKLDPFNPKDAVELQKFAMNDLYNASFINKPDQSDSVRIAKTLAAYNWGRGNLSNYLNEQKSKGVDIYDSYDWLNNLPKETSDYVNKILLQEDPSFNKNYKKASTNPKYEEVTSLYDQKKFGGDIPSAQNGQEMKFYQNGLDWKPKSMQDGGITKDNQGYWNPENWGKPVEIDSNDITMEGVYEPLLGVSDTGDTKLMKPGKNYKFKGKKVREYPVAQYGKGIPFKDAANNPKDPADPIRKDLAPPIRPKASFEEQKRIAKLELDKYGYTSDQRKNYVKGKSEKAFRNIVPQGYGDLTQTLDRIDRYEKDLGRDPMETLWYGSESSSTGKPIYYDLPKRDDAFALYLGLPQKNKSFGISEYQPGDSKENKYYFKPNYLDENLKNRLVASYFDNVDDNENVYIANERGDAFPQKTDSLEREGVPFENPMYAEWMVDNPLGDFKMSKGKDKKGHYISIYDEWDLNPFKEGKGSSSNPAAATLKAFAKMKGVDVSDDLEISKLFGAGKPFEIYDRIYYDPKTKKVIPEKRNGGGVGINQLDAQPMKKLNQLLNFTNNPDKDNWLDKYN